jgi:hypothetical protein
LLLSAFKFTETFLHSPGFARRLTTVAPLDGVAQQVSALLKQRRFVDAMTLLDRVTAEHRPSTDIFPTAPVSHNKAKVNHHAIVGAFAPRICQAAAVAGEWDIAAALMRRMQHAGAAPSTGCYSAMISLLCQVANARGRALSSGTDMFDGLQADQIEWLRTATSKELHGMTTATLLQKAESLLSEARVRQVARAAESYAAMLKAHCVVTKNLTAALKTLDQWAADEQLVVLTSNSTTALPTPVAIFSLQTLCLAQANDAMAEQLQRVWLSATDEPALLLRARDLSQLGEVAMAVAEPRVLEDIYARWLSARDSTAVIDARVKIEVEQLFRSRVRLAAVHEALIVAHASSHAQPDGVTAALQWYQAMEQAAIPVSVPTLVRLTSRLLEVAPSTPQAAEPVKQLGGESPSDAEAPVNFMASAQTLTDKILSLAESIPLEASPDNKGAAVVLRGDAWRSVWSESLVGGWHRFGQTRLALNVLDRLLDLIPPPSRLPDAPTPPVPAPTAFARLAQQAVRHLDQNASRLDTVASASLHSADRLPNMQVQLDEVPRSEQQWAEANAQYQRAVAEHELKVKQYNELAARHTAWQASLKPLPSAATLAALVRFASARGAVDSTRLLHALLERRAASVLPIDVGAQLSVRDLTALNEYVIECMLAVGKFDAAQYFISKLPAGHDTSRLRLLAASAHGKQRQQQLEAAERAEALDSMQTPRSLAAQRRL